MAILNIMYRNTWLLDFAIHHWTFPSVPRSGSQKIPQKKCLPFYRLDKVKEAGAATKDAEFFMSERSSWALAR